MPTSPLSTISKNLHIYYYDSLFYVVTLNKNSAGFWVEVSPSHSTRYWKELALIIENHISDDEEHSEKWDGVQGQTWKSASHLWSVVFYSDGTTEIISQEKVPLEIDSETGEILDGGWKPKSTVIEAPSGLKPTDIVSYLKKDFEV